MANIVAGINTHKSTKDQWAFDITVPQNIDTKNVETLWERIRIKAAPKNNTSGKETNMFNNIQLSFPERGPAGKASTAGLLPYQDGFWLSSKTYKKTDTTVPYVAHDGKYYLLIDEYSIGDNPSSSNKWSEMKNYNQIFTKFLMANNAVFGSAVGSVIHNNYLFSQLGEDKTEVEIRYSNLDLGEYGEYAPFTPSEVTIGEKTFENVSKLNGSYTPNTSFDFFTGTMSCNKLSEQFETFDFINTNDDIELKYEYNAYTIDDTNETPGKVKLKYNPVIYNYTHFMSKNGSYNITVSPRLQYIFKRKNVDSGVDYNVFDGYFSPGTIVLPDPIKDDIKEGTHIFINNPNYLPEEVDEFSTLNTDVFKQLHMLNTESNQLYVHGVSPVGLDYTPGQSAEDKLYHREDWREESNIFLAEKNTTDYPWISVDDANDSDKYTSVNYHNNGFTGNDDWLWDDLDGKEGICCRGYFFDENVFTYDFGGKTDKSIFNKRNLRISGYVLVVADPNIFDPLKYGDNQYWGNDNENYFLVNGVKSKFMLLARGTVLKLRANKSYEIYVSYDDTVNPGEEIIKSIGNVYIKKKSTHTYWVVENPDDFVKIPTKIRVDDINNLTNYGLIDDDTLSVFGSAVTNMYTYWYHEPIIELIKGEDKKLRISVKTSLVEYDTINPKTGEKLYEDGDCVIFPCKRRLPNFKKQSLFYTDNMSYNNASSAGYNMDHLIVGLDIGVKSDMDNIPEIFLSEKNNLGYFDLNAKLFNTWDSAINYNIYNQIQPSDYNFACYPSWANGRCEKNNSYIGFGSTNIIDFGYFHYSHGAPYYGSCIGPSSYYPENIYGASMVFQCVNDYNRVDDYWSSLCFDKSLLKLSAQYIRFKSYIDYDKETVIKLDNGNYAARNRTRCSQKILAYPYNIFYVDSYSLFDGNILIPDSNDNANSINPNEVGTTPCMMHDFIDKYDDFFGYGSGRYIQNVRGAFKVPVINYHSEPSCY